MVFIIYKATNKINGKHYIGYDSKWPHRKNSHFKESYNKKHKQYFYIFHKSIRKYGWDNFEWEVIYQSNNSDVIKYMEKYFIQEYNSYYLWENGGYNMTLGGDGAPGLKQTKEHIKKRTENMLKTKKNKIKSNILCVKNIGKIYRKYFPQNKKGWMLLDPLGNYYVVTSLNNFCIKNNLHHSALIGVAEGIFQQHRNWKCWKIITKVQYNHNFV